jgi:segregation and condensation protein A
VAIRAEMFAHHHVRREPLSVRERMSNILARLERGAFVAFVELFTAAEGRAGVTVTFIAVLELMREGLIDISQTEPYAPLHVRAAGTGRTLQLVADGDTAANDAAADNAAAEVTSANDTAGDATPQGES